MTHAKEQFQQKIAVVICAYTEKRWQDLVDVVMSVRQQSRAADEIVVVIDHNRVMFDRVQGAFDGLKVVENHEPKGLSGARNSGIAATDADLIAFLDDDAVADPDWLHMLSQAMDDPRVLGVGGIILPRWSGNKPRWFPEEFNWVVGCTQRGVPVKRAEVRNLVGASMLIRHSVFDAVGGFRTGIGRVGTLPLGGEETELCIRARQQLPGSIFVYEPDARVQHKVPVERSKWHYFRSRCYAEGISKAVISRFVGSSDALSAERAHVMTTLPKGMMKGVADTVFRKDMTGLARCGAIAAGLVVTGFGYLRGVMATT